MGRAPLLQTDPRPQVVVTADDLGLSAGVTRGVIEAHRRGVARSASLLVTFPSSEEAAALARAESELEVGLHLDLVGGRPVSDPTRVRSLVDAEGRFHRLADLIVRIATGRVRSTEIARELRAQVARARSWGTPGLAWDSHRHVHTLPQVARVLGPLARELGARWVRRTSPHPAWRSPRSLALGASALASSFFLRGIAGNDWYVDLTSWRHGRDIAAIASLLDREGVGELSAHPGYPDDALRATDQLVAERPADLALLSDPALRGAFAEHPAAWRVGKPT